MPLRKQSLQPHPPRAQSRSWIWKAFFCLYFFLALNNAVDFIRPDSPPRMYYASLLAINWLFLIPCLLHILWLLVSLVCAIPFYLFLYYRRWLSPWIWKGMFVLKVGLDITGRNYDFQFIKAMFHQDTLAGVSTLLGAFLPWIPAYVVFFLYAQARHKS